MTASARVDWHLDHLDCENEAATIRRALADSPGVADLKVFPESAKVSITYDPDRVSPQRLGETLRALGFPPRERAAAELPKPWRNPKVLGSAASGLLVLLGWMGSLVGASTALYGAAMLIGGYYFGREALEELIYEREIGIELLMAVAAVVAAVMGQVPEGAILVFLYSISEAAEGYTEEKTRAAIKALMELAPKVALVRREGGEVEIPVEDLAVGEIFIVKPGQAVATDGVVVVGVSNLNQAPVTGESMPVEKQPGDAVFAGSLNGEGAIEVRATKTFAENTISRIIQMVEEAQEKKGKRQRFIERFGHRYSPAVLLIGILVAVTAPLVFGGSWESWIIRATVFIVAAAPCALVISIPITLVASLGTAARQGVLIKGGLYLEELARIKVVALDKTGTLTHGQPEVTDVLTVHRAEGASPSSSQKVLAIAAGIERRSEHPLAKAILWHAKEQRITAADVTEFRALTGAGAAGRLNGETIYVGSPGFFEQQLHVNLDEPQVDIRRLQREGKTVVVVGDEKAAYGLIAIRDNVRRNARDAIAALHEAGIEKVVMLTGDNERTAQAIAREVGIDEVHADLKPEDKVRVVRELARHGHVAMVGDGVNDAPALAEATVGVAMGAAGSDVALETADVALMADDLEKLVYGLSLAKRNQRVVQQNLVLSALVIGALVVGAVTGVFTLPIAVIGHEVSEFIVIASGLRMLRA